MTKRLSALAALLLAAACSENTPVITGRLGQPTDIAVFRGCPQNLPGCNLETQAHDLLLISSGADNALRVFDVQRRQFFTAPDPLFPLAVPVGVYPRRLAVEPEGKFALVLNSGSQDVSVVDLERLVEVDTDWDSCSSFCGSCLGRQAPQFIDERCRAGVSRVSLGQTTGLFPEGLVLGPAQQGAAGERFLYAYVSLLGAGRVVQLKFTYPRPDLAREQRLEKIQTFELGGQPAGMALSADGRYLFVADQSADELSVLDTRNGQTEKIHLGAPSSEVYLAPDGKVLYVLTPLKRSLVLVDAVQRTLRSVEYARSWAADPASVGAEIFLGAIPRALAFTRGASTVVFNEKGTSSQDYSAQLILASELSQLQAIRPDYHPLPVKTLAWVATLDGRVRVLDAENHRPIDIWPFQWPTLTAQPKLTLGSDSISPEQLKNCASDEHCPYPVLLGYDTAYQPPADESGALLACSGHGQAVFGPDDLPTCSCEAGYFAQGMECLELALGEAIFPSYGVWLRPGRSRAETWQLTWEGTVSGMENGRGQFNQWRIYDLRPGVNLKQLDLESGDILQVKSPPQDEESGGDNPCRPGSGAEQAQEALVEFEVLQVAEAYLELKPVAGMDPEKCWPGEIEFRVRAGKAWTVWGVTSGGQRRLRMTPRAQAQENLPAYDIGAFGATLLEPGTDPQSGQPFSIPRDSTWSFTVTSGFTPAMFSPSALVGGAGPLVAVNAEADSGEEAVDDRLFWIFEFSNAMMEFFPSRLDSGNFIIYQ
jgi:DNA-binding beta-propeller fold protein YncE